jgi:hypothetical protein
MMQRTNFNVAECDTHILQIAKRQPEITIFLEACYKIS